MDEVVTREVKIHAPAATIFQYFTDPAKAVRWHAISAELDPRPGGTYVLQVLPGSMMRGEFLELDPPRRLVFTWGWEDNELMPPGSTTVEVTLDQDGEYTIVRVAHSGVPTTELRAQHGDGWAHYLERLAIAAIGSDPGSDPWAKDA